MSYDENRISDQIDGGLHERKQLFLFGVRCSACGEKIPKHEKNLQHLGTMTKSEIEDIECISCEMKYRDSADIDMFGV